MSESEKSCFFVSYRNPEKITENITIRVKKITDSTLGLSFICLSEFIFNSKSPIVDPKEDALRKRFENTKSLHLSIHSIISIEEVGEEIPHLSFVNDKAKLLVLNSDTPSPPQQ